MKKLSLHDRVSNYSPLLVTFLGGVLVIRGSAFTLEFEKQGLKSVADTVSTNKHRRYKCNHCLNFVTTLITSIPGEKSVLSLSSLGACWNPS